MKSFRPNHFFTALLLLVTSCSSEPANKKLNKSQDVIIRSDKTTEVSENKIGEDLCECKDPEYKLKGCDYEKNRLKLSDLKQIYISLNDSSEPKSVKAANYFSIEAISQNTFNEAYMSRLSAYDKTNGRYAKKGLNLKVGTLVFTDTIDPKDEFTATYNLEGMVSKRDWFLVSLSEWESLVYYLVNGKTGDTLALLDSKPLIHPNGRDLFELSYSPYEPTTTDITRYEISSDHKVTYRYNLRLPADISFSNEFIGADGWIYFINEHHYRITGPNCDICDYYRIKLLQ